MNGIVKLKNDRQYKRRWIQEEEREFDPSKDKDQS